MDIGSEDTFSEGEGDPAENADLEKTESELLWVIHKGGPALDVLTELFRGRSPDYSPQTITHPTLSISVLSHRSKNDLSISEDTNRLR